MENNSIGKTKIHTYSESDPLSSSKNTTNQPGHSFLDTLSTYLPNTKQPSVHEAIEQYKMDKRVLINTLLEEYRTLSEARRMELLERLIFKSKEEDEDPHSKCLEIFKKLMRGEKVSPEEMKYLMQFAPLLYLLYLMLKDDGITIEEENQEEENIENTTDQDNKPTSSIAQAALTYTPNTTSPAPPATPSAAS